MSRESARYTKAHSWMEQQGEEWLVGITDYAAGSMGDIIYAELPGADAEVTAGEAYGNIESAKAVEDLIAPLSGVVIKANEELEATPETLNEDPYGAGWIIVVKPTGDVDLSETMSAEEYAAYVATLGEE